MTGAEVSFTRNLARHVKADTWTVDDQGAVRKHMGVFVDGELISDRTLLTEPVNADSKVHVGQALSGG
jgi:molybdopterin synthase sulfur carrier subunit